MGSIDSIGRPPHFTKLGGLKAPKLIDVDAYRKRLTLRGLNRKDKALYESFKPNSLAIEDKASRTSLIQELMAEVAYRIEAYQP